MDFFPTQDLYANLLAQGVWQLGLLVTQTLARAAKRGPTNGEDSLDSTVLAAVRAAADDLAAVERVAPELGSDDFRNFLRSRELEGIVQDLFVVHLADEGVQRSQTRQALLEAWSYWTGKPATELEPHADRFLDALIQASTRVLDVAIAQGRLAALDAKLQLRHALVAERLASIESKVEALREPTLTRGELDKFQRDVTREMYERSRWISLRICTAQPD